MKGTAEHTTDAQADATPASDRASLIRSRGMEILSAETQAIESVSEHLGDAFVEAIDLIESCTGHVVVTGVGKAGDIGKKICSTLSSTGTPSIVLHPVEALHGDLGMVRSNDVILALSKSGESQEMVHLLPALTRIGCRIILITAKPTSRSARQADIVLNIGSTPEPCPLGMAPSASTTAMIALGDALALTVMTLKNIKPEQYAQNHPGGELGRNLMRVHEIMRTGTDCPTVHADETLRAYHEAVHSAPRRAGAAIIVDDAGKLLGIFTHGDLSRLLGESEHPANRIIRDVMTHTPKFVRQDQKVLDALHIMQPARIDELPVVDDEDIVVGMIDIQDLLAEGFSSFDNG